MRRPLDTVATDPDRTLGSFVPTLNQLAGPLDPAVAAHATSIPMMAGSCHLWVDPSGPAHSGPGPALSGRSKSPYSSGHLVPIIPRGIRHTKGQEKTVTIDPYQVRKFSEWSDADFDLDDLVLPEQPQWHRCGAVHCIDEGPWLGTLVCCIRRSGHKDAHSMSLGDVGSPDHWSETWL